MTAHTYRPGDRVIVAVQGHDLEGVVLDAGVESVRVKIDGMGSNFTVTPEQVRPAPHPDAEHLLALVEGWDQEGSFSSAILRDQIIAAGYHRDEAQR